MNKKTILMKLTALIFGIILYSCESHEQRADDAFERVKESKKISNDSNGFGIGKIPESSEKKLSKKNEIQEAWSKDMKDIEKKIRSNENQIKEFKGTSDTDKIL